MNTELELPIPVPRPQNVLPRLATTLEVPNEVRYRALEVADLAEKTRITIGRHPHGVAAACLYIAAQELGQQLTQRVIADVAGISATTLRTHRTVLLEALNDREVEH
ncbi:transcription initiation factor IIB family protein [Natrinema zhouii]|uniref:Transcription initiation factor IIB n=1 Tax=Natrinema zhouii TaxID=1710539 RepID=A0A7D6CPT5_9EURY|nr:transcription initiation factor IIB family protein [Natrinema zhouii]QLK26798.1 transcription initiation factor IIB family protein [Natrinema zhouii]